MLHVTGVSGHVAPAQAQGGELYLVVLLETVLHGQADKSHLSNASISAAANRPTVHSHKTLVTADVDMRHISTDMCCCWFDGFHGSM